MQMDLIEQSLRTLARRVPFHPFMVELNSGARIEVLDPEASPAGAPSLFDHERMTQLIGSDEVQHSREA